MFDVKKIEAKALSHAEKIKAEKQYKRKKLYMFYLLFGVFAAASAVVLILYMSGVISPDSTVLIPDGKTPLAGN